VAVGGTGVKVGGAGVGVFVVTREAQALNPNARNRMSCGKERSFEYIGGIIR